MMGQHKATQLLSGAVFLVSGSPSYAHEVLSPLPGGSKNCLSIHCCHHEKSSLALEVTRKQFAGSADLCDFLPVSGWLVRVGATGGTAIPGD